MKKSLMLMLILLLIFTIGKINLFAENRSEEDFFKVEEYFSITASKKLQNIKEAPATVVVITEKQIKERGYECLDDLINDLPGFDIVNVWGTWPMIWAQRGNYGDENKRTLFLIDSILENNLMEGSVLGGQQYSLHNIKQVEVVYGPASALYGANAFGGVINFITKSGADVKGVEVKQGIGSWNNKFTKVLAGNKHNDLDYLISYSRYDSNGPKFTERHPSYDNSYINNAYSLVGRLSFRNTKFGFSIYDRPQGDGTFSNRPNNYGLPGYGYNNSEGLGSGMAQTGRNSLWHTRNSTVFLESKSEITTNVSATSKIFFRSTGIMTDSFELDSDMPGNYIPGFNRDYYAHKSTTAGGEIQTNYIINERNDLIIGLQYEESNIKKAYDTGDSMGIKSQPEQIIPTIHQINAAIYAQYQSVFFDYLNVTIGGRYDDNSIYGGIFTPRAGAVYHPNNNLTCKLLYGEAFRAPNNFELYSTTNVRIANPSLEPEYEKSLELSFMYKLMRQWTAEFNLYNNRFTDNITSNVDIDSVYKQNRNIGKSNVNGIELKTLYIYNENKFEINYTWQNTENKVNGIEYDIPNIAEHKIKAFWTTNFLPYITSCIGLKYIGSRTTSITNPRQKIDSFTTVDVTLTEKKKIMNEHLGWTLAVRNLFDTKYYDPGIRSANGAYYSTAHTQPGRYFYGSVHLKY